MFFRGRRCRSQRVVPGAMMGAQSAQVFMRFDGEDAPKSVAIARSSLLHSDRRTSGTTSGLYGVFVSAVLMA
jgi:hypothetical protein